MRERKQIKTEETTTRQFTTAEIRKALGVPSNAMLVVAGRYGEDTEIASDAVLVVEWTTVNYSGDDE